MNTINECGIENKVDEKGNPTGGYVRGRAISIDWQDGPLGRDCCNRHDKQGTHAPGCDGVSKRQSPTGAFVETVLSAALQRLEFYQTASNGKFKCRENAIAITKIEEALLWLDKRTRDREARQVEGTHKA